jgi:glycogen operon protein
VAKKSDSGFLIRKGNPLPLGVTVLKEGINFSVSLPESDTCRLNLYEKNSGLLKESILMTEEYRTGSIFSVMVKGVDFTGFSYLYQGKDKEFIDPYAKLIYGRESYGKIADDGEKSVIRGGFLTGEFDWKGETPLAIPYSELLLYKLHVRGFTMHSSSEVQGKGTFLGIVQKIPYLKELGINGVLLLPIYDYNERIVQRGLVSTEKLNYWGYSHENAYFAPKAAYCVNPLEGSLELKNMIAALHQNGIEVMMEMNFVKGTSHSLILDCLRYWVMEYHIDGFKLTAETIPGTLLATDPFLGKTKLMAEGWDLEQIYPKDISIGFKNLAEYNSEYSSHLKQFLRGDEDQTKAVAFHIKRNPDNSGVIHYITNHDGFTLMDLFSYDLKHNERNGENNQDGVDYNYSWNCGIEGKTKVKKVLSLRRKQIYNAFLLLFLSQGTPLLLAGDEFGNSQEGNNNAYCQDNEISWLDWNLLNSNRDIVEFVKQVIHLRKQHPILHMEEQLRCMDYISCGFPDLSFHGLKAWFPDYSHYSRVLGVMLAGNYVKINRKENDQIFYLGINMHWEEHGFDLPQLPPGRQWQVLYDTSIESNIKETHAIVKQRFYEVGARAIVVLISK